MRTLRGGVKRVSVVCPGEMGTENKLERAHGTDNKNKKTSFKQEVVKELGAS
jgi:hypothetical protein